MRKLTELLLLGCCLAVFAPLLLADEIATLRNGVAIDEEVSPPRMASVIDMQEREQRNYPMQPPLIPHDTRNYEVNLQVNKCMSCHARQRTGESQAPMISVTHFMDREGNFLAEVSPRRYFCEQCHVTQTDAKLAVGNSFESMDSLLEARAAQSRND